MSNEGYAVWLKSFPPGKHETLYRVVRKNNRSKSDPEVHALLRGVAGGSPLRVRVFEEREQADNLLREIQIHEAEGEVKAASE